MGHFNPTDRGFPINSVCLQRFVGKLELVYFLSTQIGDCAMAWVRGRGRIPLYQYSVIVLTGIWVTTDRAASSHAEEKEQQGSS